MAKRITHAQVLGERGVVLVSRRLLDMGFLWHPTNAPLEAGIDGFIELRDPTTGDVANTWIAVQSKARTKLDKETEISFEFVCTNKDLEYWRHGNMPVLLVVSRPDTDEAWWMPVKEYFANPTHASTHKIVFDKSANVLAGTSQPDLLSLCQSVGAGTYFRPAPKPERLLSNLLTIKRFPECFYRADTTYKEGTELHKELCRRMEYLPREWILHGGVIYSVHNLREEPWRGVCDLGTVEIIETEEWSETDDPEIRRHFVWLLKHCLHRVCGRLGMRRDKDDGYYYFKATKDLSARKVPYKSRKKVTGRVVFQGYRSKKDPDRIAYYRHVGFEPRILYFDSKWCLEINPTYRFTSDGEELHPFREEYLSKIKSIEGSGAVGGIVVMFATLLADRHDLFTHNYEYLGFGNLLGVDMPVSIDDSLWRKRDPTSPDNTMNDSDIDCISDAATTDQLLWEEML
ncbi:DUF4365 domain-containing protein [Planctomycetota bacterium]